MAKESPHQLPGSNVNGKSAAMRSLQSPFADLDRSKCSFPHRRGHPLALAALLELLGGT
jgi:hypothetical protein